TFAIAIKRHDEYKAAGVPMLPVVMGFPITKRQMVVYIIALLPLPFFLSQLGTGFIIIATLMTVGWIILAIRGFFVDNDRKWAQHMFIYSLNYLTILFIFLSFLRCLCLIRVTFGTKTGGKDITPCPLREDERLYYDLGWGAPGG